MSSKVIINYKIRQKASQLVKRLRWGKGATNRMEKILRKGLGKSCKYCKEKITLKNCSIDHQVPVAKYGLNKESNLQVICLSCNRAKSNLTDYQFTRLINFLNKDLEMKKIVLMKLKAGNYVFKS